MNLSDSLELYNALFLRKKPAASTRAYKELVFFGRLVLYWPHIGLHENQADKRFMSTTSPTSMAAAVSLAIAKHAAPTYSPEAAKKSGEEIETAGVPGIKATGESQAVIDVLTAEEVGKFPSKDAAAALQRVSDVSISREFGESERVSVGSFNYPMLPI